VDRTGESTCDSAGVISTKTDTKFLRLPAACALMLDGERQRQQQWAGGVALIPTLLPGDDWLGKSCDHPESNVFVTGFGASEATGGYKTPAVPAEGVVQTRAPQSVSIDAESPASQANPYTSATAADASGSGRPNPPYGHRAIEVRSTRPPGHNRRLAPSGRNAAPRAGNSSHFVPRNRFADVRRRQIAGPSNRRMMQRGSRCVMPRASWTPPRGSAHARNCARSGCAR
jgi:hypothetical protein